MECSVCGKKLGKGEVSYEDIGAYK